MAEPIYKRIGVPATLEQAAEEFAEAAQACLKEARRLRGENPTPKSMAECYLAIAEELADVSVCVHELENAGYKCDVNDVQMKLQRWHLRVDDMEAKKNGLG